MVASAAMRFPAFAPFVLAACSGQTPTPVSTAAVPAPRSQPATYVSVVEPGLAQPVMKGPFEILTINPGSDLSLGISASGACDEVEWFLYSGGGAAVGDGQTLCVLSRADAPVTHGFSGHD